MLKSWTWVLFSTCTTTAFVCLWPTSTNAECPIFDTVPNLNLTKQLGTWHIKGILRNPEANGSITISCLTATLDGDGGSPHLDHPPVNLTAHVHGTDMGTGETLMYHVLAQVPVLGRPGRWSLYFNNVEYTASVVYTDYVVYSLIVLCSNTSHEKQDEELIALFMVRNGNNEGLPPNLVVGFQKLLGDEYGMDTGNYAEVTCSSGYSSLLSVGSNSVVYLATFTLGWLIIRFIRVI